MKQMILFASLYLFLNVPGFAQSTANRLRDTAKVNSLLARSKEVLSNSPALSINYSAQAKQLAEEIKFVKGEALALKNMGVAFYMQGKLLEALNYWSQAMEFFKQTKDLVGLSNILNNIGAIYSVQGDYQKALAKYLDALKYAEQSGNKERIAAAMNNIGATYALKKETYEKALQFYLNAHTIYDQISDTNGIATTAVNVGEMYSNMNNGKLALQYYNKSLQYYAAAKNEVSIPYTLNAIAREYRKQNNYALALKFHNQAYATAVRVDNQLYKVQSLLGLADTYAGDGETGAAISSYQQAEEAARSINAFTELKGIYQGLSAMYAGRQNYEKAFRYQTLFTKMKDTLYNIDSDKKLAKMQFDFDLQKKQGEINLLTKDKSLSDLELRRQRLAKNALIIVLALGLFTGFIIFKNYRIKVKTNKLLDRQKEEIELLLLNILPAEVANELQVSGRCTPRNYESASVLFTDFKDFTNIADKLSPQELVAELNECFVEFDTIIERNNLEKIKTIGDAYMCAGGIPSPDGNHPYNIVKAGIEIQQYIARYNLKRREKGLKLWEVRIGIHVGPVVAGVVGKKKYAYDIWGSTVNIANRMESSGAPGKVNISAATYDLVKDKWACSYRGKLYAKNVGEIDMYFVDFALDNVAKREETAIHSGR